MFEVQREDSDHLSQYPHYRDEKIKTGWVCGLISRVTTQRVVFSIDF